MLLSLRKTDQKFITALCGLALLALSSIQSAMAMDKVGIPEKPTRSDSSATRFSWAETDSNPAPLFLNSLKSTSSVVLTEKDFSVWWTQFLAQNSKPEAPGEVESAHAGTSTPYPDETGFHPVSLNKNENRPLLAKAQWQDYYLKPGDVISLQVLNHPEFSLRNILIAPDGTIALPLLGKVNAMNQSVESLTALLTQGFASALRYPVVTVSLDKIAPQRIYILGAVKKPGLYLLDGQDNSSLTPAGVNPPRLDYHLSTALVKAGGLLADADLAHVKVFNLDKTSCVEANIVELLAYGALMNDVALGLEDVIYVPRLDNAQWNHPEVLKLLANSNLGQDTYPIRVYGYVTRPDVYQLSPTEMSLQSVLAKAGLDIDKAQPKQVIVARTLPNQQMLALKVDATKKDMILFPNDSVIVSKGNWKHWIKSAFGAASAITLPAANIKYILDNTNVVTP
jgi:polysaccharide export outer membrane protein